jgi:hypothetical protein
MTRSTLLSAAAAGLVLSLSGVALAQAPVPYQRSMNPSDTMHGGWSYPADSSGPMYRSDAAPQRIYRYQSEGPLAHPGPGGTTIDPSGRVQTDRFGNVVRGNTCADHPANCAFDPGMMGGGPTMSGPAYVEERYVQERYVPARRYYLAD